MTPEETWKALREPVEKDCSNCVNAERPGYRTAGGSVSDVTLQTGEIHGCKLAMALGCNTLGGTLKIWEYRND